MRCINKTLPLVIWLVLWSACAYANLGSESRMEDWLKATEAEKVSFCKAIASSDEAVQQNCDWTDIRGFIDTSCQYWLSENRRLTELCALFITSLHSTNSAAV